MKFSLRQASPLGRSGPPGGSDRDTTVSPSTKTSIFVRRKQSSASSGRHTTGSFSLNEVLSTIGTPVRRSNASIAGEVSRRRHADAAGVARRLQLPGQEHAEALALQLLGGERLAAGQRAHQPPAPALRRQ